MDDVGQLLLIVPVGVVHTELGGQQHIDLDRNDGIFLTEYVLALDVQLGTVESGLVDANLVIQAQIVQNLLHDALRLFPLLGSTLVLIGTLRIPLGEAEGAVLQQSHGFQNVFRQLQASAELLLQLIGAEHQMSLGNGELTDTDQTVHLTGILVAEQSGGLAKAHGQLTVGALLVQIYLILEGAGHGTESEALLALIVGIAQNEHTVQVVIPVTGDLVKLTLRHQRRLGQQIAALFFLILDPSLEPLDDAGALGHQNRQTLSDLVHGSEQLQLAADLVVIPLAGFLTGGQKLVHLRLGGERGAVHTLEHLVLGFALPIRAGAGGQFQRLDSAGGEQVRAGTQIHEIAHLIEGNFLALGDAVDEEHLVGLALFFHQLLCLVAGQGEALQLLIFLDDLLHLRLNLSENLGGEGHLGIEIVVESVINSGSDGQFCLGIQAFYRLRQNVRCGMTEGAAGAVVLGIGKSEQFYVAVALGNVGHIHDLAVYAGAEDLTGDNTGAGSGVVDGYGGFGDKFFATGETVDHKNLQKQIKSGLPRPKTKNPDTQRITAFGVRQAARFHPSFSLIGYTIIP